MGKFLVVLVSNLSENKRLWTIITVQKRKFSVNNLFTKYEQIHIFIFWLAHIYYRILKDSQNGTRFILGCVQINQDNYKSNSVCLFRVPMKKNVNKSVVVRPKKLSSGIAMIFEHLSWLTTKYSICWKRPIGKKSSCWYLAEFNFKQYQQPLKLA